MAGLRELRKRLKSVRTTGQFAGAMRTVAAAKYARVGAAAAAYREYAEVCAHMRELAGDTRETERGGRKCLVVIGGNRGFCGGFNSELMSFFHGVYAAEDSPLVMTCGKTPAAYCRERGIDIHREFAVSDIPAAEEGKALSDCLRELCAEGTIGDVEFVYQKFTNMLTQRPARKRVNAAQSRGEPEVLCLPDADTVERKLQATCFDAEVLSLLLESAAGAQAATLIAMRAAYDNASDAAGELEITINRRRQTEVTASVLETAADNE